MEIHCLVVEPFSPPAPSHKLADIIQRFLKRQRTCLLFIGISQGVHWSEQFKHSADTFLRNNLRGIETRRARSCTQRNLLARLFPAANRRHYTCAWRGVSAKSRDVFRRKLYLVLLYLAINWAIWSLKFMWSCFCLSGDWQPAVKISTRQIKCAGS